MLVASPNFAFLEPAEPRLARLLRQVTELKPGRGYLRVLAAHRTRHFHARVAQCTRDAAVLAPWLDEAA